MATFFDCTYPQAVARFLNLVEKATFDQLLKFSDGYQTLVNGKSERDLWQPRKRKRRLAELLATLQRPSSSEDHVRIGCLEDFPATPPFGEENTSVGPLIDYSRPSATWNHEFLSSAANIIHSDWTRHWNWYFSGKRVDVYHVIQPYARSHVESDNWCFNTTNALQLTEIFLHYFCSPIATDQLAAKTFHIDSMLGEADYQLESGQQVDVVVAGSKMVGGPDSAYQWLCDSRKFYSRVDVWAPSLRKTSRLAGHELKGGKN